MKGAGILAKSAVLWNAGFSLVRDLMQFAMTAVLARLLAEEAYGQFTLVQNVLAVAAVFSGKTTIDHILQLKDGEEPPYQDHFTAAAVMQTVLFVLLNTAAFGLHSVEKYQAVAWPLHAMSVVVFTDLIAHFRYRTMERNLEFRRMRGLHLVGIVLSQAASLIMAWLGCGVYALLLPSLLVVVPFAWDLFVKEKWRPTWSFSMDRWRPSYTYAKSVVLTSTINQGRTLLESAALAWILSFTALAHAGRAQGLAKMFCVQVIVQIVYAIYPLLTRLDTGNGQASRANVLLLQLVAWLSIPVAGVFSLVALPAVHTVYGDQWTAVADYLPVAMVWGVFMAFNQVAYFVLLSRNELGMLFKQSVANLVLSGLCLVVLYYYGMFWWLAASAGTMALLTWYLLQRLVRVEAFRWRDVLAGSLAPLVAVAAGAAVAFPLSKNWCWQRPDHFLTGLVVGCVFLFVVLGVLRFAFGSQMAELVRWMPGSARISKWLRLA